MEAVGLVVLFVVVILVALAAASVRIVQEYERGVIFRLGRVIAGAKGPGLFFIIPVIDRMTKVNLQTVTMNVPVSRRDHSRQRHRAAWTPSCTSRWSNPVRATVNIQDYLFGTSAGRPDDVAQRLRTGRPR